MVSLCLTPSQGRVTDRDQQHEHEPHTILSEGGEGRRAGAQSEAGHGAPELDPGAVAAMAMASSVPAPEIAPRPHAPSAAAPAAQAEAEETACDPVIHRGGPQGDSARQPTPEASQQPWRQELGGGVLDASGRDVSGREADQGGGWG